MTRSARRAQLLDAAREVFGAHGYHAAAMDEIAERAGVSKPVLYQHFPGKLDLYRAARAGRRGRHGAHGARRIRSTTDNKARVQATIQAYFDFVSSRDGAMPPGVRDRHAGDARDRRARGPRRRRTASTRSPRPITNDAGLEPERARLLAVGLVGLSTTAARYWLDAGLQPPREDAITLMSQLAWRGIGGFPRQEG